MQNRREFLRKSLKIGAIAGAVSLGAASVSSSSKETSSNGVVSGKSKKKEVLYHKTKIWEQYYKIAY